MCGTIVSFVATPLLSPPTSTARIVPAPDRLRIWQTSPAFSRRMVTPDSASSMAMPEQSRSHLGSRVLGAYPPRVLRRSGSTISPRRLRRRWIGTAQSMPSKRALPARRRPNASSCAVRQRLCLILFSNGQRQQSTSYWPNLRWQAPSARPSIAASLCPGSSQMADWRWTTTSLKMQCV